MKLDKNIILIDTNPDEGKNFCKALSESTQIEWHLIDCISNKGRTHKYINIIRYFKYFIFPLRIFLNRKKIDNIVTWQQFYGLIYAFYCRFFHIKKKQSLLIMTFIYKRKKGIIGKIYHQFIKYIITSKYIDILICTTNKERFIYSELFNVNINKFVFVPWGIPDYKSKVYADESSKEKFIFSTGRSNRDWNFLIKNLKNTEYKLKIACDELQYKILNNIEIYNDIHGLKLFQYFQNCYCVIISIEDPNIASGQTVLLYAMQFKKPLIVTKSSGLTDDYIINNYNGLIIEKNKDELLNALEKIYNDKCLYEKLATNGYNEYETKYSTSMLGKNIGSVLLNSNILIKSF